LVFTRDLPASWSQQQNYITIDKTGKKADVKSIISLMALGVKCGERIVFSIEGDDEETAAQGLEEFCGKNL
jgi:phosphocarrier protein HPr